MNKEKIANYIAEIFDVEYSKQHFEETTKKIGSYLSDLQEIVDVYKLKDVYILTAKLRLIQNGTSLDDVNVYDSYVQSLRSRAGKFLEHLLYGFFDPIFKNCQLSPTAIGTSKKADLAIDDRIVIDSTTSNRERLKDKIRYKKMYPNFQLHLISLDKNPPSAEDLATFKKEGVHIVITESAFQKLDKVHQEALEIHTLKNYIDEVRLPDY